MDVIEAINSRKSIRGFKPDPVPREVLADILEVAIRAPSAMNTQPWEFTVVAGEVMEKLKQANLEKFNSGETPQRDVLSSAFSGKYRERQVAIAVQLFQLMNIARDESEKRTDWLRRGARFFDAPAAIIISVDEALGDAGQFGIGAISQTIALAALHYGLGTCIHGQGLMYTDVVREFTAIAKSKQIITCLSIGYPDWDFPANKVHSEREPISNITSWCGL